MKITKTNNLNFGTTIRVVSPECFNEIRKKLRDNDCEKVSNWAIVPKYADDPQNFYKKIWLGYRVNAEDCYTTGVRSCVSGVVANKKANDVGADKASLFMHIENTKSNIENLHYIKPYFEGTNAILIGSKKHIHFSSPLFSGILNMARAKMPTTIFKGLTRNWETDIAYLSEPDVLYMTVKHIHEKNSFVRTLSELLQVFDDIFISKCDKLEVLPKCKECIIKSFNFKQAEKILKKMK